MITPMMVENWNVANGEPYRVLPLLSFTAICHPALYLTKNSFNYHVKPLEPGNLADAYSLPRQS